VMRRATPGSGSTCGARVTATSRQDNSAALGLIAGLEALETCESAFLAIRAQLNKVKYAND
jgi:hypothetical protein